MMKPAPAAPLEVAQPQLLLQFFVVAFDDPAMLISGLVRNSTSGGTPAFSRRSLSLAQTSGR
jgi:hypothetical protein